MQDIFIMLSKFVPPERILKLCFLGNFRFYVYKINHICKMRRLFWSNYKDLVEGVNLEFCWELIPYIPEHEYARLKPKGDFDKFMFYIGPFYRAVNITYIVIWAIFLEDLETVKKLASLGILKQCSSFYTGSFPVHVGTSKILPGAICILRESNPKLAKCFTGLSHFITGKNVQFVSCIMDRAEIQLNPDMFIVRSISHNLWKNITYLLRYCGEIGRNTIRNVMNNLQNYSAVIYNDELVCLTKDEIEYLRQFRKKWTRAVYFKLTCLVLPQKNLNIYIRKNAGLIVCFICVICNWDYCGYIIKPSKREKIRMMKIMVRNKNYRETFIRVVKTPFVEDTLLKLKYRMNPNNVLDAYNLDYLDALSIKGIVSMFDEINVSRHIPPKLWEFVKDLTPSFGHFNTVFLNKDVYTNLKNIHKYSRHHGSIQLIIKELGHFYLTVESVHLKRNYYKLAQLYGVCID